MSELIYSFVIILIISGVAFWLIKKALPDFLPNREFKRWRFAWLITVIAGFVTHSIWLLNAFIVFTCIFIVPAKPKDRIIYFLLLLCALPMLQIIIPGFGSINYIFVLTYPRLLTIALLLNLVVKQTNKPRLFSLASDKYIVSFVVLTSYLTFRDNTFTNALREILMEILDIFIPYFVVSRHLDSKDQLDKAFLALVISLSPLAIIGILETLKHWHIFNAMKISLTGKGNGYDIREGSLRASTIFGGPIVLGYIMVIGFGLLLYLKPFLKNRQIFMLAVMAFVGCLLSTMARGPWVGLACVGLIYLWTGREGIKKISLYALATVISLPLIALSPVGSKFIDLLPFVGTSRSDTVEYRTQLIEKSWIVFQRHPWLGSTTFLETPEMESMRQGQGIIDLVNTFIALVLPYGIIGMILFLAIFATLIIRCYITLKRIPQAETDLLRMGRILLAILTSVMLMIATFSPIDFVPVFYWLLAGIMAAYLHVTEKTIRQYKAQRLAAY